jgi:hypothetical protein
MNVSWDDVRNVLEAGDYPFRDGTINLSFAEVAIWKNNPGAKFQLMRKHPVRGAFKYVLGKQIEEKQSAAETKLIYESSNGDSWFLTRNPLTGARTVMHRPNAKSGGQESYIEIDRFLSEGANGPEHQALSHFLEIGARDATILIGYDIHPPRGEAYDAINRAIQALGSWWHHLETIWIVQCPYTPGEIRDRLKGHIGIEDQLLVIDISGDEAGWVGLNDAGSKWLSANI